MTNPEPTPDVTEVDDEVSAPATPGAAALPTGADDEADEGGATHPDD